MRHILLATILIMGVFAPGFSQEEKSDNDVVRAMILLKSDNWRERRESALQLAVFKDQRAVDPLIAALKDQNGEVRKSAAYALGELGDRKAVKPLLALGKKDEDARTMAVRSLGRLRDPAALSFIEDTLESDDSLLVFEAALALGEFPGDTGVRALTGALSKADTYGCKTIVNVLGKKGSLKALSDLERVALGKDEECALSAVSALGALRSREALPALQKTLESGRGVRFKIAALESLGFISGDESLRILLAHVKSLNPDIQVRAIESLGELGDPRAGPALKRLENDSNPKIREAVDFALSRVAPAP